MINQNDLVKESLVWGEEDADGDVVVNAKLVLDRAQTDQKVGQSADESELKRHLDQIISEINRHLPSFKSIRHYVFSFQDMVKTTTLKIRRPIEIAGIRSLMESTKLRWRELTGRNLDQLTANPPTQTVETNSPNIPKADSASPR
jgi:long-chain acyl-CoA synthetase